MMKDETGEYEADKCDVYSLGCILFNMLVGEVLIKASNCYSLDEVTFSCDLWSPLFA